MTCMDPVVTNAICALAGAAAGYARQLVAEQQKERRQ